MSGPRGIPDLLPQLSLIHNGAQLQMQGNVFAIAIVTKRFVPNPVEVPVERQCWSNRIPSSDLPGKNMHGAYMTLGSQPNSTSIAIYLTI